MLLTPLETKQLFILVGWVFVLLLVWYVPTEAGMCLIPEVVPRLYLDANQDSLQTKYISSVFVMTGPLISF